jgi:L-threonylcarbamoyladenylate synthase
VSDVDDAVAALRTGQPVILPTDTVYGLCASPGLEDAVKALSRLKGRAESKPIALVAADLERLLALMPELSGRSEAILRAVLPGPYTLILTNPAHRYPWLNSPSPETIGIRIPDFEGAGAEVLSRVGAVAATSANLSGGSDPCTLDEVPDELRSAVAAAVDGGELPGRASTVVDFSGPEPVVLREGAGSAADAIARAAAASG